MARLKEGLTESSIHYTLHEDYYFPGLGLPEESTQTIGRYKAYLEEHRPGEYTRLIMSGHLYDHLTEIDACCVDRMNRMIQQMAESEDVITPAMFNCRSNKII